MRTRIINRSVSAVALAVGFATAGSLPLHALTVNLTTAGASGSVNGAFFQQVPDQSTGTGVIDPFVRLSAGGGDVISGYNATARPVMPDVNTSPTFTRDLQFGEIPQVVNPIGAASGTYLQFLLDINQTAADPLLSLHELEIYVRGTPLTTANIYPNPELTNKLYDLDVGGDGDSLINLNYSLNPGSGAGDMFAYIPISLFAGVGPTSYVYLYSAFGLPNNNNDGFEEWSVLRSTPNTPPGVPEGGMTAILLGSTLVGLAFIQRRILS